VASHEKSETGRRGLLQESENYAPKIKQASRELEALILVHDICDDLNYFCVLRIAKKMLKVSSALVLVSKTGEGHNNSKM
jgi:hypothetical protein